MNISDGSNHGGGSSRCPPPTASSNQALVTARTSHTHVQQPRRARAGAGPAERRQRTVEPRRSRSSNFFPPPAFNKLTVSVSEERKTNLALSKLAGRLWSPIWKRGATPRGVRGGQPSGLPRLSRLKWMTVEIFLWECGGGGGGGGSGAQENQRGAR